MKHQILALGVVLSLAAGACYDPVNYQSCPFYCWQSDVPHDEIPESPTRPGYFDQQCTHSTTADGLWAPIPPLGLASRVCYLGSPPSSEVNTENYFLVKSAIQKLKASEALSPEEETAYDLIASLLDHDAFENCVANLTCNGNPGVGCDIDPTQTGEQSCSLASATSLCTNEVMNLLESLLDRSAPSQYPECSGTQYYEGEEPFCEGYVPDFNDTEGPCAGDGMLPGTGSTSFGGQDSTGEGSAPFGDIGDLISCNATDCDIDSLLLINIMENFSEFYDAGVTLQQTASSGLCGQGILLDGLTAGTAPSELASAFNMTNGDIILSINGIPLNSATGAAAVLDLLDSATTFSVVVGSPGGNQCHTTTWTLEIVR